MFKIFKERKKKEISLKVPKSMQEIIPVKQVFEDGIFLLEDDYYSKTWQFEDINYQIASEDEQLETLSNYIKFINSLDNGVESKLTINNRKIDKVKFFDEILLEDKNDGLDVFRKEYNDMLVDKITDANSIVQEKYLTVKGKRQNIDDARSYFASIGASIYSDFDALNSKVEELKANERVRIFHDFFHKGEESNFFFDFKSNQSKGHNFKDYILPDSIEVKNDYLKLGKRYARVLFIREYANFLSDTLILKLTELNKNMLLNIDIKPIPSSEALTLVDDKLLGIESNIAEWQNKNNRKGNFVLDVPYHLRQQKDSVEDLLNDLTQRDQRLILVTVTLVLTADSIEELDDDTRMIIEIASKYKCQIGTLSFQQLDGLITTLPFGLTKIDATRTLTSESVAALIPFRVQEICQPSGIYYGQNAISKNLILADRYMLQNPNSFILGVSGSGKSFTAKQEIIHSILASEDDVIVVDPEGEYSPLVQAFGGEVINISTQSNNHINAMEAVEIAGDDENFVKVKSEFLLTLIEMNRKNEGLSPVEKSIIDRCVHYVYSKYQADRVTLKDFYEVLKSQDEKEAKRLAVEIEILVTGSLNIFSYETNVDIKNRLICFNIKDLGNQLKTIGMLVMLDYILNRIKKNKLQNKRTYLFIDEIHVLFLHEYTAEFLESLWKRIRKYKGCATGITQNVEDLLRRDSSRTMLSNSEFLVLLNQSSLDAQSLSDLLQISDAQVKYMTGALAGEGLLKIGKNIIPFKNNYPKNNSYKLMDTSANKAKKEE